jgi:hypothetical protein
MSNMIVSVRRTAALALAAATIGLCGATAQAKSGGAGWQDTYTYTPPTGSTDGFFTYSCPTGLVARSGAFFPNPTLQAQGINLGVNAPRLDLGTGGFNGWGFEFNVPGGVPAGATILFNVYCTKAPA